MSDLSGAVAAILAETNELIPTKHFEQQCEAMTALGRVTWMPCRCRERQAARQAANLLRTLAARRRTDQGPLGCWTVTELDNLADEIEEANHG